MNASRTIEIAPVRKSLVVDAAPDVAFAVFTAGIDRWWPRTHGIGPGPVRESVIEPFVGGRWYTRHEDGSIAVVGHVRVWRPGEQLTVTWEISADWKPDPRPAFTSEVAVRFSAEPDGRTRVELEHRNFERMDGAGAEKMRRELDGGWPAILERFAQQVHDEAQAT
jgi:uncharacterized protein YndB with AHSA1/START domain